MQDVWHEYNDVFCQTIAADHARFAPSAAFWPGDVLYAKWQSTLRLLHVDHKSRNALLDMLFGTVELRCGQPHERATLEVFRSSPFLVHGRRTHTVYVYINYVYDPWVIGSIAYDYPNVTGIYIIIEAPLERRDRDDLMFFVRQMCQMGKKVTLTPAWTHWQARHRGDISTNFRPVFHPDPDPTFGLL